MNPNYRSFILWGIVALLVILLFSLFQGNSRKGIINQLSYSDFIQRVDAGQVKEVTIQGANISGVTTNDQRFVTYVPRGNTIVQRLESKNVMIRAEPEVSGSNPFFSLLGTSMPMIILIAVWIFFMRQMQGGSRGAMGFGKSKAKLLTESHGRITFDDVAGVDEAKADLEEIVEFLQDPQKFQRLGGRIPRGVLLVGPPVQARILWRCS